MNMQNLLFILTMILTLGGASSFADAADAGKPDAAVAAPAKADSAPATKIAVTGTTEVAAKSGTGSGSGSAAGAAGKLPNVNPDDPGAMLKFLINAVRAGKWAWAAGLFLMLLTWGLNRLLKQKIPKKVLPWLSIGLGMAANVSLSFASGADWLTAIGGGLTLGLVAIGGWEALTKLFRKDKDESNSTPNGGGSSAQASG